MEYSHHNFLRCLRKSLQSHQHNKKQQVLRPLHSSKRNLNNQTQPGPLKKKASVVKHMYFTHFPHIYINPTLYVDKEIMLLKKLSHPKIVQYYGSTLLDDSILIFMEFLCGNSILKERREFKKFDEKLI